MEDYIKIVERTAQLLLEKNDWRSAYERYAEKIEESDGIYKEAAEKMKKQLPKDLGLLRIYSSIDRVQKSTKSAYFDLRIFGQSVGGITYIGQKGKLFLTVNKKQQDNNKKYLNLETHSNPSRRPYEWDSDEAKNIIKKFVEYKGDDAKVKSPEHQYESLILHDLIQTVGKRKKITYCRPVMLGDFEYGFFQMRTVFAASKHEPEYKMSKKGAAIGGGIDILARIQHKNENHWRLAIMELKDENTSKEPQATVMTQALIYATFIGYLLRDNNCGKKWWNIFRNQEDKEHGVFQKLKIDVVTVMPTDNTHKLPVVENGEIPISGIDDVTLCLYSLYVDTDSKKTRIENVSGTLSKDKKL